MTFKKIYNRRDETKQQYSSKFNASSWNRRTLPFNATLETVQIQTGFANSNNSFGQNYMKITKTSMCNLSFFLYLAIDTEIFSDFIFSWGFCYLVFVQFSFSNFRWSFPSLLYNFDSIFLAFHEGNPYFWLVFLYFFFVNSAWKRRKMQKLCICIRIWITSKNLNHVQLIEAETLRFTDPRLTNTCLHSIFWWNKINWSCIFNGIRAKFQSD